MLMLRKKKCKKKDSSRNHKFSRMDQERVQTLHLGVLTGRLRSGSPNVSVGSVGSKIGSVKGKEKVDVFDAGHSSGDESLDEEFGIPTVRTPGVQRV